MKSIRLFLAATLLAGCLASCSKDDDSGGGTTPHLPTFEELYSYIGRSDTGAIASEFRQLGYAVWQGLHEEFDVPIITAKKDGCEYEFRGEEVYQATYNIDGSPAARDARVVNNCLVKVLTMMKDYGPAESVWGEYSVSPSDDLQRSSSIDSILVVLQDSKTDVDYLMADCWYADGSRAFITYYSDEEEVHFVYGIE